MYFEEKVFIVVFEERVGTLVDQEVDMGQNVEAHFIVFDCVCACDLCDQGLLDSFVYLFQYWLILLCHFQEYVDCS